MDQQWPLEVLAAQYTRNVADVTGEGGIITVVQAYLTSSPKLLLGGSRAHVRVGRPTEKNDPA